MAERAHPRVGLTTRSDVARFLDADATLSDEQIKGATNLILRSAPIDAIVEILDMLGLDGTGRP